MNSYKESSVSEYKDTEEEPKCSVAECHLAVDVVLESSDGISFGAHTTNLETYSSGFPPCSFRNNSLEVVTLPESSEVLGLLLQYMHHQRQPDSSKFQFKVLSGLAEAVEKYMVFSAMEVCKIRMKQGSVAYPLEVFKYAVKHDYLDLGDEAAIGTISLSLDEVKLGLQDRPDILFAWVQYRERWFKILSFAFEEPPTVLHRGGIKECVDWPPFHHRVLEMLGGNAGRVRQIKRFFENLEHLISDCSHCKTRANQWCQAFERRIASVPKFSTFL